MKNALNVYSNADIIKLYAYIIACLVINKCEQGDTAFQLKLRDVFLSLIIDDVISDTDGKSHNKKLIFSHS